MAQAQGGTGARRGHRVPHRRGAGPGQLPDLRRGRSRSRQRPGRPGGRGDQLRGRPRLGAQGDHLRRGAAGGRDHAGHHVAGRQHHQARATPVLATPTRADGTTDEPAGDAGLLVERRHDHDRRQARRADRLYDYQKRFGLGKPTGEGMPGEAAGRLLPPDEWSGSAYGSVPIGHERRRHPAADGRRVRGHRQRRRVRPAAPGQGDRSRRTASAPRRRRRRPARCSARRTRPALRTMLEAVADRRRTPPALRPRSPATGSPARPAPASGWSTASTARRGRLVHRHGPGREPAVRDRASSRTRPDGGGRRRRRPGVPRHDGSSRCATTGCRRPATKPPKFEVYPR